MKTLTTVAFAALILIGCTESTPQEKENSSKDMIEAPVAKKEPKELTTHGHTRNDPYYWMRLSDEQKNAETPDAQTQQVLDYLNAENDYRVEQMAHTEELQDKLYEEIVGRIKQTDMSVPTLVDGYYYYTRYEEGQDYAMYCRKKESLDNEEEIMLNGPEMAEGHSYFSIGGRAISTDNNLLAYGLDTVSRRKYTVHFKNLE
ncbi:MAG: oligopeptidase B, partial [Flavobacteriales bacterium]|nr:oligopeptidase B [Flavobacteriales bacterium]